MTSSKILDYIRSARARGKTDIEISEKLRSIGLSGEEINEAILIKTVESPPIMNVGSASPAASDEMSTQHSLKSHGRTLRENIDIVSVPLILHVLLGIILSVPALLLSTFIIARRKTYSVKDGVIVGALFGVISSLWNVATNYFFNKQYADIGIVVYLILSIFGSMFMIVLYIVLVVIVILVTNKFFKKKN
jgi:hypothetical protein